MGDGVERPLVFEVPMLTMPSAILGYPLARAGRYGQGIAAGGSTARALLPASMAGLPGNEGDGLRGPAVVLEAIWIEARVGEADLVPVDAVAQAAGASGADQVVAAGRGESAINIVGCSAETGICGDDGVVEDERAAGDIDAAPTVQGDRARR